MKTPRINKANNSIWRDRRITFQGNRPIPINENDDSQPPGKRLYKIGGEYPGHKNENFCQSVSKKRHKSAHPLLYMNFKKPGIDQFYETKNRQINDFIIFMTK